MHNGNSNGSGVAQDSGDKPANRLKETCSFITCFFDIGHPCYCLVSNREGLGTSL